MKRRLVVSIAALSTILSITAACAETAVRMAYPSGINAIFPIVVKEAKLDEKHGWRGDYSQFQYGPPMMEALASGAVDIVVLTFMPVTSYLSKAPGTIRFVADLGSLPFSLVVRSDVPAKGLADLKSRKIAVSFGSDENLRILEAFKAADIDPKDILLNLPPSDLPSTFASRIVDGIMIRQPQLGRVSTELGGKILESWTVHTIVIGRSDFIAAHPDIVARLRASFRDSIDFTKRDSIKASTWFSAQSKIRQTFVEAAIATITPPASVEGSASLRRDAQTWFDTAYALGMIKRPVAERDLFD